MINAFLVTQLSPLTDMLDLEDNASFPFTIMVLSDAFLKEIGDNLTLLLEMDWSVLSLGPNLLVNAFLGVIEARLILLVTRAVVVVVSEFVIGLENNTCFLLSIMDILSTRCHTQSEVK
jgi:hypothetical protein